MPKNVRAGFRDFCCYWASQFSARLEGSARALCCCLLLWRVEEDCGAILRAKVGSLPVYLGRIVNLPEDVQQLARS